MIYFKHETKIKLFNDVEALCSQRCFNTAAEIRDVKNKELIRMLWGVAQPSSAKQGQPPSENFILKLEG